MSRNTDRSVVRMGVGEARRSNFGSPKVATTNTVECFECIFGKINFSLVINVLFTRRRSSC